MVLLAAAAGVAGICIGSRYRVAALVLATAATLVATVALLIVESVSVLGALMPVASLHGGYLLGLFMSDALSTRRTRRRRTGPPR